MIGTYGHGRHMGMNIRLNECMGLGSSRILIHMHMSKLVVYVLCGYQNMYIGRGALHL